MQAAAMYNDFGTLAGLRTDARQGTEGSLREVAEQFESLFVQMMLKSMRDATVEGGLFDSNALDSYEQMYDQQLSLEMSSGGGIGLADVLVEQLRGDRGAIDGADSDETVDAASGKEPAFELHDYLSRRLPSMPANVIADVEKTVTEKLRNVFEVNSPAEFVDTLRPLAERAAQRLGVNPEVLLAQAALETGWGKHVTADPNGSSNNLFNIKAGSDWAGPATTVATLEYRDGVAVRETAQFRAYETPEESFEDYVNLIESSPRYRQALEQAADSETYLRELQRAGYATDPAYADKILSILKRGDAGGEGQSLKNSAARPLQT